MSDTLQTQEVSVEEIYEKEAIAIGKNPFLLIEEGFLTIKTKTMQLVKLYPNSVQKVILKKIKEIFLSGRPLRLWILKARQVGVSTVIEALIYAFTSRMDGVNACVIADDLDGSNYIFEMQKLYHEQLDEHLKPQTRHSNEKKLEFSGLHSQILIDTAENPNAGRKYTFHFVHLSETARFKKSLKNLLLGLNQSVPQEAGTMIIGETTANGLGNEFYDEWVRAIEGKSDWQALFIAWFELPEYKRLLEDEKLYPIEGMRFITPLEKETFLREEKELKKKHNLTDEQINWRRWTIVNNCDGSVLKFSQEFPASWQEAFLATGDIYFDRQGLLLQEEMKPIAVGNFVLFEGKYIFRENPNGLWKIYEYVQRDEQYVIGGDPAEGLPHGDNAGAIVLNKRTNDTVAVYKHRTAPDQFAIDLVDCAKYYNNAMVACENKGYGSSVNKDMYAKYGNLFRMIKDKSGSVKQTQDLGWNTNVTTRNTMLAQLAEEIRENATALLDTDLIRECWTFICNPDRDGRPEADKGKTDDLVFARAIAGQVRNYYPYIKSIAKDKGSHFKQKPIVNQGYSFKK